MSSTYCSEEAEEEGGREEDDLLTIFCFNFHVSPFLVRLGCISSFVHFFSSVFGLEGKAVASLCFNHPLFGLSLPLSNLDFDPFPGNHHSQLIVRPFFLLLRICTSGSS